MAAATIPALLTLPAELLGQIAEGTDKTGLLSLRLTSRRISKAAGDVFRNTFFIRRDHLLTTYSLERLVKITEQPQLCSKLESLTFSVLDMCYLPEYSEDLFEYGDAAYDEELFRMSEEEYDGQISELFALQGEIESNAPTMLAICLKNLARANVSPTIKFEVYDPRRGNFNHHCGSYTEPDPYDRQPYGCPTLFRTIPLLDEYSMHDSSYFKDFQLPKDSLALSSLLNAISESGFQVRAFGFSHPGHPIHDGQHTLRIGDGNENALRSSFEGLQSLEIDFGTSRSMWIPDEWLTVLGRLIGFATSSISRLSVHLADDSECHGWWANWAQAQWIPDLVLGCRLKEVEICGYQYVSHGRDHGGAVLRLLQENSSLTSLRLCPCDRVDPVMLAFAAQELALQHVEMSRKHPHGNYRLFCDLHGSEEVKSELLSILKLPQVSFWGLGSDPWSLTDEETREAEVIAEQKEIADEFATSAKEFQDMVLEKTLRSGVNYWNMFDQDIFTSRFSTRQKFRGASAGRARCRSRYFGR